MRGRGKCSTSPCRFDAGGKYDRMMKRVVSSSIVTVVVLIAAAAAFFYISRFSGESGDPVACIPSDAVFYIESAPGSAGVQELLKPDMWNAWKQSPVLGRLYDHLISARQLMQNEEIRTSWLTEGKLVLSAHVTGASTFDFLILQGFKGSRDEVAEVIGELAGDDFSVSEREYDGNRITEVALKSGKVFTWALVKGVFAGSFTSFLVEDAVRQQKVGKPAVFKPASSSEESGFAVYLNFSNLPAFLSLYTIEGHPALGALKSFSNWFTGEITASQEGVILDGVLSDLDSSRFSHCFSGQKPVAPTLLKFVPATAAAVLWYGASDMKHFRSRLEKHHAEGNATGMLAKESKRFGVDVTSKLTSWVKDQYALVITEPSSAQFDNNVFAVFKADPVVAEKALTSLASSIDKKLGESTRREEYHGHSIGYLRLLGAVPALYGERFSRLTRMYYTITGDYVVFANQASSLRNYIDEIRSGHLFSGHLKGMLPPTGANFGCFVRPEAAIPVYVSAANSTWKTSIEKYREVVAGTGIFSFVMAVNGQEMHATARLDHVSRPSAPARMLFSVEADTSVTMVPLLASGKNGTRVVFQDDANGLYMADDAGNVIWKFRIDNRIMSRIYPVDYFRNGNMQFLFNTASHIYLIDEKGTPVGNYPIRLPAAASNAMVLAPTGNPGENAMYVACENRRVYAYLLSGRPMSDWSFTGTAGMVRSAMIPFTLDGKRVLLISDDQGTATVVSASGKPALSLSQGFAPAVFATVFTDSVSSSRELIVTSDESGNIVKVSGDGKVEILPVAAAPPGHGFLCTDVDGDGSKDFVFAAGREVTAYDASMAVIFRKELEGDLDGHIYSISEGAISGAVGVTSVSSNKTWLLKPDGSVMDGFPVRGSGGFVTGAVGSDGKLHLITGSRSGVNVYTLE